MYVISQCIKHLYQVTYVSQAPLAKLFYNFSRDYIEQILETRKRSLSTLMTRMTVIPIMILLCSQFMRTDRYVKDVFYSNTHQPAEEQPWIRWMVCYSSNHSNIGDA